MNRLSSEGINLIIYEPTIKENLYHGSIVVNNFNKFIEKCDLILTNRMCKKLKSLDKVIFTRDLYQTD